MNKVLIGSGSTLIFAAVSMLMGSLREPAPSPRPYGKKTGLGRVIYLAGLGFFLLSIFLGSGAGDCEPA